MYEDCIELLSYRTYDSTLIPLKHQLACILIDKVKKLQYSCLHQPKKELALHTRYFNLKCIF